MHEPISKPGRSDYALVSAAIAEVVANAEAVSPAQLAHELSVSSSRLSKAFRAWAGISPGRFIQYVAYRRFSGKLKAGVPVLLTAAEGGYSSASRLYDCAVNVVGMTPGEVATGARDVQICWGVGETPFGPVFIGWTKKGVCSLQFIDQELRDESDALDHVRADWPEARLQHDLAAARAKLRQIFTEESGVPVSLNIKGTNFQLQVWQALLGTGYGQTVSYGELADRAGNKAAHRAVGTAVAKNPVAVLIPCHRVIRASGVIGDYRWGAPRKQALLLREWLTA